MVNNCITGFWHWPNWTEMLRLSTGDELNNLPMITVGSWSLSCMVGIWHWHIPTFIITDISPPWWDFVMVGICRQAMMMMMVMMMFQNFQIILKPISRISGWCRDLQRFANSTIWSRELGLQGFDIINHQSSLQGFEIIIVIVIVIVTIAIVMKKARESV